MTASAEEEHALAEAGLAEWAAELDRIDRGETVPPGGMRG
jgi:hypothetical protein